METTINVNETAVALTITTADVEAYRNAEVAKLQTKLNNLKAQTDGSLADTMSLSVIKKLEKKYEGKTVPANMIWDDVKALKKGKGASDWTEFLIEAGLDSKERDGVYQAHKLASTIYNAMHKLVSAEAMRTTLTETIAKCKSPHKNLILDFLLSDEAEAEATDVVTA